MVLLLYPYFLVVFWYRHFFLGVVKKSFEVFSYAVNLLSVPLLIKMFFKPLKNEYREGLVLFSILMGIVVKTLILAVSIVVLFLVLSAFLIIDLLILVLPILIVRFVI